MNTGYSNVSFTLDISVFDTSRATDMENMFNSTGYSSTIFSLEFGENFNTSKVTDKNAMFLLVGYSNPNMTNCNQVFYDVAVLEGTSVVVNYTSETESLVDSLLEAKSASSYVKKGSLV